MGNKVGKGLKYKLSLFITGTTPVSARAVVNVRRFCEEHLGDSCDLEIIDIRANPKIAKEQQLIAAPTLIKHLPLPARRLIGDMSAADRLFAGLDLKPIG